MPTASINSPNAVLRVNSQINSSMTAAMIAGIGKYISVPLPSHANPSRSKVTICPSVISWAMPRPATISISVATIGCICSTATKKPFHRPHSVPTARAAAST
ncbi:hypothetical protein D3C85_1644860 [compost metagenome]